MDLREKKEEKKDTHFPIEIFGCPVLFHYLGGPIHLHPSSASYGWSIPRELIKFGVTQRP